MKNFFKSRRFSNEGRQRVLALAMVVGGCFVAYWLGTSARPSGNLDTSPPNRFFTKELPLVIAGEVEEVAWDFPVINDTRSTLKCLELGHSCTCTNAKLGKRVLHPGERTTLHIEAGIRGRIGPQRFTSRVFWNDGGAPWIYELTLPVLQRVQLLPPHLDLGVVEPNRQITHEATVELLRLKGEDLPKIVSVTTDNQGLNISFAREPGRVAEGGGPIGSPVRKAVYFTLAPQTRPGPGQAEIVLRYSHRNGKGDSRSRIHWFVKDLFELTPKRLFFGNFRSTKACQKKTLIIRCLTNRPFLITGVLMAQNALAFRIEETLDPAAKKLTFYLDPSKLKVPYAGEVLVQINDPDRPEISVPIAAIP